MLQFENEIVTDINHNAYETNRQKLVKIGLSALFPGLGHFYSGQYKIGAIYSTIEVAGWLGRDRYLSRAKDTSIAYKNFAKEHWSLARWFKYYFNPIGPNAPAIETWFTHIDDEEVPFKRPWENSHGLYFYYNGQVVGTKGNSGMDRYLEICEISESDSEAGNFICNADLEEIEVKVGDIVYDHHFFEGIGKYNLYFAGWDDSEVGYMEYGRSAIAYTPNKKHYENVLRANHKDNNNTANDFLSLLLINRAVSIIDIILRKNNKNISINTTSGYDIDNRYYINSLKLSIAIN